MSAKFRAIYTVGVCLITASLSFAQKASNLEKDYDFALNLFYEEYYPDALEQFLAIEEVDSAYRDVPYRIEILRFMAGDYERSIQQLLDYGDSYGQKDKFYHYWLGQVFAKKYLFGEAIRSWNTFLGLEVYKSEEIVKETRQFIDKAEASIAFFSAPSGHRILELEALNSPGDERFPLPHQRQLIYLHKPLLEDEDMIVAGMPFPSYNTKANILENLDFEISSISMASSNAPNIYLVNESGNMIVSKNESSTWSDPSPYGLRLPKSKRGMDIFITKDESTIFFTRAKKYKKLGLDLFYVQKSISGVWGKPQALPSPINSEKNQRSPYFHEESSTLYFSSDGFESIGGFDIFSSVFDSTSNSWSSPERLPYPINTPNDEVDYYVHENGVSYLSSNRLYSKGGFDIYGFVKQRRVILRGNIASAEDDSSQGEYEIVFQTTMQEDEYEIVETKDASFEANLIAGQPYSVEVLSNGRPIYKDTFQLAHDVDESTFELAFNLPPPEAQVSAYSEGASGADRASFEFSYKGEGYRRVEPAIMENLYFDFGVINSTKGAERALEKLMGVLQSNPEIILEIAGHTDNIGPAYSNWWVSRSRAEQVKSMLIERGISDDRFVTRGYGERYPIASNDDERDGRELNRRIEFYIVEAL